MSMKGPPGALMASVLAASTVALASASGDQSDAFRPCSNNSNEGRAPSPSSEARAGAQSSTEDAFAPRFDGLKFVETLVTAHR
ncbi:uncharacterized protein LOC104441595 [Eucalyptus grandis]|uniref:uncharacterized protein LOC104441595 n=1 Tax=Eucalyptus grandis TaxID=71139 RepID=UPI00192E9845|nr:uncharacterized protein LOC104441595 [Eucalyptus grandis]